MSTSLSSVVGKLLLMGGIQRRQEDEGCCVGVLDGFMMKGVHLPIATAS